MAIKRACQNELVINLENGEVITQAQAYERQLPYTISTGTASFQTAAELQPVPGCSTGNCGASDCPEGREIAYLSLITHVRMKVPAAGDFAVELVAALFTDNLNAIPQTPVYKIDLGDGAGYHAIVVGGTYTLDVSAFANGDYSGNIIEENSGAIFKFFYTVAGGEIENYMSERIATVTLDLNCDLYPNYSVILTDQMVIINPGSFSYRATEAQVKIFTSIVDDQTFIDGGVFTYTTGGTLQTDLVNVPSPENLVNTAQLNIIGEMENVGKLITQCINS